MSSYLQVLLISISVPFILSFYPPLGFYRNIKALFFSILLILLIFGSWDVFATWRGHWFFEESAISGLHILNLPVEEWLFFPVITFCCIFTWEALKFIKNNIK